MGMTITEKILTRHTDLDQVSPGMLINARVDIALGNDITAPIAIEAFRKAGAKRVFDPEILEPVMQGLLAESLAACLPTTKIGRITLELIRVFDSTLWKVVPRMGWAGLKNGELLRRASIQFDVLVTGDQHL
jgi:hypothetical protein